MQITQTWAWTSTGLGIWLASCSTSPSTFCSSQAVTIISKTTVTLHTPGWEVQFWLGAVKMERSRQYRGNRGNWRIAEDIFFLLNRYPSKCIQLCTVIYKFPVYATVSLFMLSKTLWQLIKFKATSSCCALLIQNDEVWNYDQCRISWGREVLRGGGSTLLILKSVK